MAADQVTEMVHRLKSRVHVGDFTGYAALQEYPFVMVGEDATGLRMDLDDSRRGFERAAARFEAAGWTGFETEVSSSWAAGGNGVFALCRSRALSGETPVSPFFTEGFLLRQTPSGLRVFGFVNPPAASFWPSVSGVLPASPDPGGDAQILRGLAESLLVALNRNDLGAYLSGLDMPYALAHDGGVVACAGAGDVARMLNRWNANRVQIDRYEVRPLSMQRISEHLVAARFQAQVTLPDGTRRDPWTNLYIFRRRPDGWRIALVYGGGVGPLMDPAAFTRTDP